MIPPPAPRAYLTDSPGPREWLRRSGSGGGRRELPCCPVQARTSTRMNGSVGGEILSARLCAETEVRALVKPLLADRIAAALDAVRQGVTVLCEQGRRVG